MSQLAASDGQPGNWEEPDFSPRLLEPVRVQTYGWQEPCESRDSRTVLWERGGEIPLRDPTSIFWTLEKFCDNMMYHNFYIYEQTTFILYFIPALSSVLKDLSVSESPSHCPPRTQRT